MSAILQRAWRRVAAGLRPAGAVALAAGLLAGCATESYNNSGRAATLDSRLESMDLKELFDGIAAEFCTDACNGCVGNGVASERRSCGSQEAEGLTTGGSPIIVTDSVDLVSFEPKTAGITMAELLRGSLHNVCCYRIVQGEFSRYFKMSENGFRVLTRSAAEVSADGYAGRYVAVGTYEYKRDKLLLFVKKIDTTNNQIVRMVSKEIDFTRGDGKGRDYLVR